MRVALCFAHLILLVSAAPAQNNSTDRVCPSDCTCGQTHIRCEDVALEDIVDFLVPSIKHLELTDCDISELHINLLENATDIEILQLTDCGITSILRPPENFDGFRKLRSINFGQNELLDFAATMEAVQQMAPNVASIDLSDNYITTVNYTGDHSSVRLLNLSRNYIDALIALPRSLQVVDLSHNAIANLSAVAWPPSLTQLTLSHNVISDLGDGELLSMPRLLHLDVSHNEIGEARTDAFEQLTSLRALDLSFNPLRTFDARMSAMRRVERFQMTHTDLRYLDADRLSAATSLRSVNISHNRHLSSIIGQLGGLVETLDVSNCDLRRLPDRFFIGAPSVRQLHVNGNGWLCAPCVARWHNRLSINIQSICNATDDASAVPDGDCLIGVHIPHHEIVREFYGGDAVLHCNQYGQPPPTVRWFVHPHTFIGSYDPTSKNSSLAAGMETDYAILPGGVLLLRSVNRDLVERYTCVAENEHGNMSATTRFRLDMSAWYRLSPFDSVFIGSVVCGVLAAFASFIVNMLWLAVRKLVLWRISRAERTSRVRKMVEAMEKYRQKQMLGLHEKYTKRIAHVRDNYHQQVEQMRSSYTSQSERFRDYRAAQMETMTQHLDTIRDNYNQQIGRMREYGSRRADQLWESYERQVNRIRTFSLQQRLRLMRQYKIKQRYLNKLLESLNVDANGVATMTKQDSDAVTASILAALDEANELQLPDMNDLGDMSAASSYYSLPELFLDENGTITERRSDSAVPWTHSATPPRQSSRSEQSPSSSRPFQSEDEIVETGL